MPTASTASCSNDLFLRLLQAHRPYGGLLRRAELPSTCVDQIEFRSARPVCLYWGGEPWLPCFQFLRDPWRPCLGAAAVVAELRPAFDDAELTAWFVEHNSLLHGRPPVAVLHKDLALVTEAARVDRFVAAG